jgi:adenine-specific DNA-methyltransferase
MPALEWIGKNKIVNYHREVPFHVLSKQYSFGNAASENMVIHGDNLITLKALLPKYEKSIDVIYIDPPYNTGNENWIYNDNVNDPYIKEWIGKVVGKEGDDLSRHDKWLCMMYPRLKLLEKMLKDGGVMAISIGYQEVDNLMAIVKEIFPTRNIALITVQTSGGKPNNGFNLTNEYLIFITPIGFEPIPDESAMNAYATPYHALTLATFNQVQRPNQAYPIYIDGSGKIAGVGKSLQERQDEGSLVGEIGDFVYDYSEAPEGCVVVWPITKKGEQKVWRLISSKLLANWKAGYIEVQPQKPGKTKNTYSVSYLSEGIIEKIKNGELEAEMDSKLLDVPTIHVKNYVTGGVSIDTTWVDTDYYTEAGSNLLRDILGNKEAFPYPKPLALVYDILKRCAKPDALILDAFAGSGTTGHAVLQLNKDDGGNRHFVCIEMGEYAESVTAERIKRAINGYADTENCAVPGLGGGFSYYEIGPSLFDEDGFINSEISIKELQEFVYYLETKKNIDETVDHGKGYLGNEAGIDYYLLSDEESCLDYAFCLSLNQASKGFVIYAYRCTLSEDELKNFKIQFKKLPTAIRDK